MTRRNRCPLRNNWRYMDRERRMDALFMVCPHCKDNGSHVDGLDAPVLEAPVPARGRLTRAEDGARYAAE